MTSMQAVHNIRWLYAFRALRSGLFMIPVAIPFFQQNGLSQTEIFLTQSAFALTIILLEVPSGYFADRYGRRNSLLFGSIIWAAGFAVYSVSYGFAPIVFAEVLLGIGASFISGADSALAFDSLVAAGKRREYRSFEAKSLAGVGAVEGAASIIGGLIAVWISLRATVAAQLVTTLPLIVIAWKLREPPRKKTASHRDIVGDVLRVVKHSLHGHPEIKWLIVYAAVVGTSTHTMVWLTQRYFQDAGVPLGWFGVLWAVLLASMMLFARFADRYENLLGKRRALGSFVIIGAVTYASLAFSVSLVALPLLLGFYFIRAVFTPILRDYINDLVESDIRATVLSVQSLAQKLLYIGAGPLIGYVMDLYSLQAALLFSGGFYGTLGLVTLGMMKRRSLL